jgi:hypothetical protein
VTKGGDPVPLTGTFPGTNILPAEHDSAEDTRLLSVTLPQMVQENNPLPHSGHLLERSYGSPRTKFLGLDRQEIDASLSIVRDYIEVKSKLFNRGHVQ